MKTPIWEQMPGESLLWFSRFERFRRMEFGRSVASVFHEEYSKKLDNTRKRLDPDGTWYEAAIKWRWEERASAWDAYQSEQEEKIIAQEKAKILRKNFALMHKRIQALDQIADKLCSMTEDDNNLWLLDVKSIGNGPGAQRVDLRVFNDGLIRETRGCLKDLAEETGGRIKKTETAITTLPKRYINILPDDDGSEE